MPQPLNLEVVGAALALADFDVVQAQSVMAPLQRPLERASGKAGDPKQAAVLLLLYPHKGELRLVLIRRNSYEGVHSDQIGLPGGRLETGETYTAAALRECHEELGVAPDSVQLLGELTRIYIPPSDFDVQPIVGYVPARPVWRPDPREVAEVIEIDVQTLLDEDLKSAEQINVQGMRIHAPYYDLLGHKCWGATAIILAEFEGRIKAIPGTDG